MQGRDRQHAAVPALGAGEVGAGAQGYPKARILRPNGDPTPRGVVPDLPLPSPVAQGEDDAVMQAALAAVRAARLSPAPGAGRR